MPSRSYVEIAILCRHAYSFIAMTEEMRGFEEDGGVHTAHSLCQEYKALRERLTDTTRGVRIRPLLRMG